MKEILSQCFSFLLIGLILIKISSFHVYEHLDSLEGSVEHCEQCLITIDGQKFEGLIASVFTLKEISTTIFSKLKIVSYDSQYVNNFKFIISLSRPPPSEWSKTGLFYNY